MHIPHILNIPVQHFAPAYSECVFILTLNRPTVVLPAIERERNYPSVSERWASHSTTSGGFGLVYRLHHSVAWPSASGWDTIGNTQVTKSLVVRLPQSNKHFRAALRGCAFGDRSSIKSIQQEHNRNSRLSAISGWALRLFG